MVKQTLAVFMPCNLMNPWVFCHSMTDDAAPSYSGVNGLAVGHQAEIVDTIGLVGQDRQIPSEVAKW